MKLKHYNIVAISIAILLALTIYCFKSSNSIFTSDPTVVSISNVLQLDSQIYSTDVGVRIREMKNIDLSGCPNDFKVAFNTHINAWEAYNDDGYGWSIAGGFVSGLVEFIDGGTILGLGVAIDEDERQLLVNEISNTYIKCLIIADKYNVNTSTYRK